jgi:hypothetical protein
MMFSIETGAGRTSNTRICPRRAPHALYFPNALCDTELSLTQAQSPALGGLMRIKTTARSGA